MRCARTKLGKALKQSSRRGPPCPMPQVVSSRIAYAGGGREKEQDEQDEEEEEEDDDVLLRSLMVVDAIDELD